jgi:ABC-type multidrug transport system fused ATPase/permease subunit
MTNIFKSLAHFLFSKPKNDGFYNKIQSLVAQRFDPKPFEIDFSKPFWHSFKYVWVSLITSTIVVTASSLYSSLFLPIFVYAIDNRSINTIVYALIGFFVITLLMLFVGVGSNVYLSRLCFGIRHSAYKFFLSADPILHSTKSSGQIITKINRGSNSLSNLVSNLIIDILPALIKQIVIATGFFALGFESGIIIVTLVLIQILAVFILRSKVVTPVAKWYLPFNEKLSEVAVEILTQHSFIRSVFASEEENKKNFDKSYDSITADTTRIILNRFYNAIVKTIWLISFIVILILVIPGLFDGSINLLLGSSLIYLYISTQSEVTLIGRILGQVSELIVDIDDLFDFIKNFGKQSYPALLEDTLPKETNLNAQTKQI